MTIANEDQSSDVLRGEGTEVAPSIEADSPRGDEETHRLLVQIVRGLLAAHGRIDVLADKLTEACEVATRDRLDKFTARMRSAISDVGVKTLTSVHSEMEQVRAQAAASTADTKRGLVTVVQAVEELHGEKLRHTELGRALADLKHAISTTNADVTKAQQYVGSLQRSAESRLTQLSKGLDDVVTALGDRKQEAVDQILTELDNRQKRLERKVFDWFQWVWGAMALLLLVVVIALIVLAPR